ncbi:hypothetical protein BGX26_003733 [Mortierella sp. AD094]|nr:hypothetical protein BGX26_003733 [Mortierella sp. AD094]
MVQTIMSSCPSLEILDVNCIRGYYLARLEPIESNNGTGSVTTENIVLEKDWVCPGLKSLTVNFTMTQYRDDMEPEDPAGAERSLRHLDLRLKSNGGGLDSLASLRKLEQLQFCSTFQQLSMDEVDWMLEHWPRLHTIYGAFSEDAHQNSTLLSYAQDQLDKRMLDM